MHVGPWLLPEMHVLQTAGYLVGTHTDAKHGGGDTVVLSD